jgi:hypothetical protein
MRKLLITSLLLFPLLAIAQQPQPATASPSPASSPNADEPGGFDPGGAEINIITEGDKLIEEYSLNGRVYMVKIQQKGFPPEWMNR